MNVGRKSYAEPFELGKVLLAGGIAEVYRVGGSGEGKFKKGDIVNGMVGWEQWTVARKDQLNGFQKIDPIEGVPLSYYLGVLGMCSGFFITHCIRAGLEF